MSWTGRRRKGSGRKKRANNPNSWKQPRNNQPKHQVPSTRLSNFLKKNQGGGNQTRSGIGPRMKKTCEDGGWFDSGTDDMYSTGKSCLSDTDCSTYSYECNPNGEDTQYCQAHLPCVQGCCSCHEEMMDMVSVCRSIYECPYGYNMNQFGQCECWGIWCN
jgi:hypothetical protein